MRISSQFGCVLSGTAALAILAGCAGGTGSSQPGLTPQQQNHRSATASVAGGRQVSRTGAVSMPSPVHHGAPVKGFFSREAMAPGGAMGFISDDSNNVVYILNTAGVVTATLTGFSAPDGMSIDKAGNLYVANVDAANVFKFAPPYNGTPTVINDPGQFPVMVAVDSNGNVAVTSGFNTSGGPGQVALYTAGSTNPTNTITDPSLEPFFCAFDAAGNLYIDGLNANNGSVTLAELVGGISGTSISLLTHNNTLQAVGGVQVTKTGNIAVDDQIGRAIYSYNPPSNGSLGSPVATTPLNGAGDPVNFALGNRNLKLVTADNSLGQAQEYDFPAGGSPVLTSSLPSGAAPIGAAINPTAQYARF